MMNPKAIPLIIFLTAAAVLAATLFFIGCGGNTIPPIFESPDSVTVTTLDAIQGKRGHLLQFLGTAGSNAVTTEAVLAIRDADVSSATFYILLRHSSADGQTSHDRIIRWLNAAKQVSVSPILPPDRAAVYRITIGKGTPQITHYLHILTPNGGDIFLLINITLEKVVYDRFWEMVAAGPKVIGGSTDTPFVQWLKQDPVGLAPAYISEVRNVIGPEDFGANTEPDISVVRKKQEQLVRATYGENYQDDVALHWAIRVVDKIDERFRRSWIDALAKNDFSDLGIISDDIIAEESGIEHLTINPILIFTQRYERRFGVKLSTRYGVFLEYLRLYYTHQDQEIDTNTLITLFEEKGRIITENPWYK